MPDAQKECCNVRSSENWGVVGGQVTSKPTSNNFQRVQCNLWSSMVSCSLHRGIQHSVHYGDLCVVEDQTYYQ